jgi:hypothetical protein
MINPETGSSDDWAQMPSRYYRGLFFIPDQLQVELLFFISLQHGYFSLDVDRCPALHFDIAADFHIGIPAKYDFGSLINYKPGFMDGQLEQAFAMRAADPLRAHILEIGGSALGALVRFYHLDYSTPVPGQAWDP